MLNLSPLFHTTEENEPCLHSNLDLTPGEREDILEAKKDVRLALKANMPRIYKEEGHEGVAPIPRFFTQGSSAYKTLNAPAKPPQQADIDDGCYLPLSYLSQTKRPSVAVEVFFDVAEKALTPLCNERGWGLSRKPTCLRVQINKRAHIDVPLYAIPDDEFEKLAKAEVLNASHQFSMDSARNIVVDRWEALPQGKVLLAHLEDGWTYSDPRPIKEWFIDQVEVKGEQLRRVIRYLKAYRDWTWPSGGPSSILLMAAAAPLFQKFHGRDDTALLHVAQQIPDRLRKGVSNPTNNEESLTDRLRKTDPKTDVVEGVARQFEHFAEQLEAILDASNTAQACTWMQQLFGERFPDRPHRAKVLSTAVAAGSVAAAIAATPAQAGPSEIVGRTRAG